MTLLSTALENLVALLALGAIPAIVVGRQLRPGALAALSLGFGTGAFVWPKAAQ